MSGVVQVLVLGYLVALGVSLLLLGLVVAVQDVGRHVRAVARSPRSSSRRKARVALTGRVRSGHV